MTHHATAAKALPLSASRTKLAAMMAALLGLAVIYTVGFAGAAELHNAAHDSRHTAAFPCH